ncbi:MAG: hypothetical protein EOO04_13355 [Chitinophagaceae bacterium]|nr:MAG: hypothetical protein EOO04_13355 [Chitinophagaceae bacterium]
MNRNPTLTPAFRRHRYILAAMGLIVSLITSGKAAAQPETMRIYFRKGDSSINVPAARQLDQLLVSHSRLKDEDIALIIPDGKRDSKGANDSLAQKRINSIKNYLHNRMAGRTTEAKAMLEVDKPAPDSEDWVDVRFDKHQTRGADIPPMDLSKVAVNETIPLENLEFEGGTARLLPKSTPSLYSLLNVMKKNPRLKIKLEGHICCIPMGSEGVAINYGINLSFERAKAVYDFLIRNDVSASRLSFTGFGNTQPLKINGYADISDFRNRRVEIRIMEK